MTGIAHVSNISQIKVRAKEHQYNLQAEVFKAMANASISVDFINISPNGVVYTITEATTDLAISILKELGYEPDCREKLCKSLCSWCWNKWCSWRSC